MTRITNEQCLKKRLLDETTDSKNIFLKSTKAIKQKKSHQNPVMHHILIPAIWFFPSIVALNKYKLSDSANLF